MKNKFKIGTRVVSSHLEGEVYTVRAISEDGTLAELILPGHTGWRILPVKVLTPLKKK